MKSKKQKKSIHSLSQKLTECQKLITELQTTASVRYNTIDSLNQQVKEQKEVIINFERELRETRGAIVEYILAINHGSCDQKRIAMLQAAVAFGCERYRGIHNFPI